MKDFVLNDDPELQKVIDAVQLSPKFLPFAIRYIRLNASREDWRRTYELVEGRPCCAQ